MMKQLLCFSWAGMSSSLALDDGFCHFGVKYIGDFFERVSSTLPDRVAILRIFLNIIESTPRKPAF